MLFTALIAIFAKGFDAIRLSITALAEPPNTFLRSCSSVNNLTP
jgi:hypothetical protein